MLAEQAYSLCACEGDAEGSSPLTSLQPGSKSSPKLEGWLSSPEEQMLLISEFTVFPPLSLLPADT